MTGLEQHSLSDPKFRQNSGKAMSHIIRRLVQEIPGALNQKSNRTFLCDERFISSMFQADRDVIIMQSLILAGQLEQAKVYNCSKCGEKLEEKVNLLEVDIFEHEEGQLPELEITLPREMNIDGVICDKVVFRYPLGIDQEKMAKYANKGEFYIISCLISLCCTFFGVKDGSEQKKTLSIQEAALMNVKNRNHIVSSIQEMSPGPDLIKESECDTCGHMNQVSVDIAGFLLPDERRSRRTKN